MKAGSDPRPISDTTEAITALRMTIEVVFVCDKDESTGDGHKTDSIAKKQPATAALNPVKHEATIEFLELLMLTNRRISAFIKHLV